MSTSSRSSLLRGSHGTNLPLHAESGLTLVEIVVVFTLMTVALAMYASTSISTAKMRSMGRESAKASDAARTVIERMHNVEWRQLYATFNADPADDPGGPGTAPGNRFEVPGLEPVTGAESTFVGEIVFPAEEIEVQTIVELGRLDEGGNPIAPVLETKTLLQLREDFEDDRLGMPRDLNGDNVIDDLEHAGDYVVLPVRVRVTWAGRLGPQSLELCTMFVEYRRRP